MDTTFIIVGFLFVVLIVILWLILKRLPSMPTQQPSDQSAQIALLVQQQVEALRGEMTGSMKNTADTVSTNLKNTTDSVNQQIAAVVQQMQKASEMMNNQLAGVTRQVQEATGQVGNRLDGAAKVIGEVQKNLGELGKATQEIKELGQNVSKLEEMLQAPKLRGGLGELMLEELLKQVIPASSYATQYRFRNGQTVDAIIRTPNGIIPIDAKFPFENFRKMIEAQADAEKRTAYRTFINDVKKHIDAIAQKYILPDEGTFDFALMYIPAENIYYETIIKNEVYGDDNSLYEYAYERRVFPVSPNTFYTQLQVVSLGFKGLQIEKSAKEIIQNLSRLQNDLQRFAEDFETVGRHLTNAKNKYDESARKLDMLDDKLKLVTSQALPEGQQQQLDGDK
ncbi:MAG: DNA recombination protein RmuC [Bacteroidota bacterium]